jgi:hypothetical protein
LAVRLTDNGGSERGGVDSSPEVTSRITILPVNDAPAAQPQRISSNEDAPAAVKLNALDSDGDELTYSVTPPAHGRLSGSPPALIYTPATNFFGADSFTFTVNDGQSDSAPALVTISVVPVNDAPIATARAFPLATLIPGSTNLVVISPNNSNAPVVFDASLSFDVEGDALTFLWSVDDCPFPMATGMRVTNTLAVGTHTVVLLVSDGVDAGTDTILLEVLSAGEAIEEVILALSDANLERKNKRPLIASLKAAIASFDRGQFHTGANQLRAFQNKLRAQVAGDNPERASALAAMCQSIIDASDNDWSPPAQTHD